MFIPEFVSLCALVALGVLVVLTVLRDVTRAVISVAIVLRICMCVIVV